MHLNLVLVILCIVLGVLLYTKQIDKTVFVTLEKDLEQSQSISTGEYKFELTTEGVLEYTHRNKVLWKSDNKNPGSTLSISGSQMILKDSEGTLVWFSDSENPGKSYLRISNKGDIGLYTEAGDLFYVPTDNIELTPDGPFKIKDLGRNCINGTGTVSSCETAPEYYYNPGLQQIFFKDPLRQDFSCLAEKNGNLTVQTCDFNSAAQRFQNDHKKMLIVNSKGCMTKNDKSVSFENCEEYNKSQKFIISPR
jgi:hypothetical protein